jgi:hypothetical protein
MAGMDVEHVAERHPVAAERPGVAVVPDLKHPAVDMLRLGRQEALDVVAVDWPAARIAEAAADRLGAPEIAE